MAISFNSIPIDLRTPGQYVEIDNSQAVRGLPGMPSRILVLGQKLSAGTATANVPVQITRVEQAEALFGRGSMLHRMFRTLKGNNAWTETWAIPQADNGSGTAAAGSVAFSGTITGAGTLALMIAGQRIQVAVTTSSTPTTIATAVAAAITAKTDLPVTAAVPGGTPTQVDLTARHKGENGNAIDVRVNYYAGEVLPAGLAVTVTAMASGAGNPDVATAITAMADTWWTDIIMPWTDAANLSALETELAARFGPLVSQDAIAWTCKTGTHAQLITFGGTRNSPQVSTIGVEKSPSPPEEWAAAYGAVAAYYLRIDPARPVQTLPLTGVLAPAVADAHTLTERNLLLYGGISTFKADAAGAITIDRAVTSYRTAPGGASDPSYLDVETMKTLAFVRYQVRARIALRYPRHKLASDGTRFGGGQAIVTPAIVRAELVALFREMEAQGLVEGLDQFKADLLVERDANDPNRLNALIPPDLVNQFRVFAAKIQFLL